MKPRRPDHQLRPGRPDRRGGPGRGPRRGPGRRRRDRRLRPRAAAGRPPAGRPPQGAGHAAPGGLDRGGPGRRGRRGGPAPDRLPRPRAGPVRRQHADPRPGRAGRPAALPRPGPPPGHAPRPDGPGHGPKARRSAIAARWPRKNTRLITASFAAGWMEAALDEPGQPRQRRGPGQGAGHRDRRGDVDRPRRLRHDDPGRGRRPNARPTSPPARSSASSSSAWSGWARTGSTPTWTARCWSSPTTTAPGLIGFIGTTFGRHGVNIAQMNVGREQPGRRGDRRGQPRQRPLRPRPSTRSSAHPDILSVSLIKLPEAGAAAALARGIPECRRLGSNLRFYHKCCVGRRGSRRAWPGVSSSLARGPASRDGRRTCGSDARRASPGRA